MKQKKALVLLSGGQDSTTCLYWAGQRYDKVMALAFDYDQSHKVEIECAKKIAKNAGVPFEVREVKGLLAPSSINKEGAENAPDHNETSYVNPTLPASFTAGRNLLFLTIAASVIVKHGFDDIVTGVCQTDYSGYPDCRRDTIDALQLALNLGMGSLNQINIVTPLMHLSKAQTWKMAKDLGVLSVIINDTMTDYNGDETMNEWGMGNEDNPASKLRAEGFREAKNRGWI